MTEADWTKLLQPPVSDQIWRENFSQGPVSDRMWSTFRVLVNQSHLYSKHKAEARVDRDGARIRVPGATKAANRIKRDWLKSAAANDGEWHRAEFLAHEVLMQIEKIGMESNSGSPEEQFAIAIIKAVGPPSDPTQCNFSITALRAFDVANFLALPEDRMREYLRERSQTTPSG